MATLAYRFQLLRGLLTGEIAHAGPAFVDLDLTERCNMRCVGCIYHSPLADSPAVAQRDIPMALVERLSSDLRQMGTQTVILQGAGEPLLHPHVMEIVALLKNAGFQVYILTNGTLLDRERAQALVEARLDLVRVSLWGTTPDECREQYPGTRSAHLGRVIENLRAFAARKAERQQASPRVVVHFPINTLNYQSIDRMIDLAQDTGCNGVSLSPWSIARGAADRFSLSPEQEREVVGALRRARQRLEALSLSHNLEQVLLRYRVGQAVWEKYPCYVTWYHTRIRVDGTLQPCGRCQSSLGSLQEASFRDLWNGPALRSFRWRTLTRAGVAALAPDCDCNYCCFIMENVRVHRLFRWFSPLSSLTRQAEPGAWG